MNISGSTHTVHPVLECSKKDFASQKSLEKYVQLQKN